MTNRPKPYQKIEIGERRHDGGCSSRAYTFRECDCHLAEIAALERQLAEAQYNRDSNAETLTRENAAMRAAGEAVALWAEEQCADFDPELDVIQDALGKIAAWRKAAGEVEE